MKRKEDIATQKTICISEIFCKYHPFTFLEPRFTDVRLFWECPECEREFFNESIHELNRKKGEINE